MAGIEVGTISMVKSISDMELTFEVTYQMPLAMVKPMDGLLQGGSTVTVSARGWFSKDEPPKFWTQAEIDTANLVVAFADHAATLISVEQDADQLVAVVKAPASSDTGNVPGSISADNIANHPKVSRFMFSYFKAPTVSSITPSRATLLGKTTSGDGRSVLLKILNAPLVESPSDMEVHFDSVLCGAGRSCGVVEMKNGQVNGANQLQLRLVVPPVPAAGDVSVIVSFVQMAADRSPKMARTKLQYYIPLPTLLSARWCKSCSVGARTCLVMGACGGGEAPIENQLPLSGGGTIILVVRNPQMNFKFAQHDGSTQHEVSLTLGEAGYGSFQRVAMGDGTLHDGQVTGSELVVFEFGIPSLFSPAGEELLISILPSGDLAPKTASIPFTFFDDRISLECLSGCEGSALGLGSTLVALTNFPLDSDLSLRDQISCTYGAFAATNLAFAEPQAHSECSESGVTCLHLTQPACDACIFDRGAFEVQLSVTMKTDAAKGAMTSFTYWSAPIILFARMNSVGTEVTLNFDQDTNMASMEGKDTSCTSILNDNTISKLADTGAQDVECIWASPDSLSIFLGNGATLAPDQLVQVKTGVLKSSNAVSEASVATIAVQGPEFPVKPVVSLQGTAAIDPCSELWLTALADSPRDITFRWSCSNDATLNAKLSQVTGAELYLAEGTAEMTVLDKSYDISVTATDFLGTTSDPVILSVLKMSSAAPKLTFDPPTNTLEVFREEDVLVKVVAEFSKCPIDKGSLVFEWTLASRSFIRSTGDDVFSTDASVFQAVGSQLLIPGGILDAAAQYTFAVNAYMQNDPSKTSQGAFTMEVRKHELVASIRGGAGISASTTRALVLDASDSMDPDFTGTGQDELLSFEWSCSIMEAGLANPCRNKVGAQLTLSDQSIVTLSSADLANLYPTGAYPYVFKVEVSKGQMTPQTFEMPVTLVETPIPAVAISSPSGKRQPDGSIRINPYDFLVLYGACTVSEEDYVAERAWTFFPAVDQSVLETILDEGADVTSKSDALLIEPGEDTFLGGSTYTAEFRCTAGNGESAVATFSISVNAAPRGDDCTSCRMSGSKCAGAHSQPSAGEAIFDDFRVSCANWADPDGNLEYQFGYSIGTPTMVPEVAFDWMGSRMVFLNLPPGNTFSSGPYPIRTHRLIHFLFFAKIVLLSVHHAACSHPIDACSSSCIEY
jgi:hypothetical protein